MVDNQQNRQIIGPQGNGFITKSEKKVAITTETLRARRYGLKPVLCPRSLCGADEVICWNE